MEWKLEPEEIFATGANEATGAPEVLVSWKGLPEEEATWE